MTTRIFVDVTRTNREATYTGIQKVVRTTFRALQAQAPAFDCEVVPIAIDDLGAYRLRELKAHPYEGGFSPPRSARSATEGAANFARRLLARASRYGSENAARLDIRLARSAVRRTMARWRKIRKLTSQFVRRSDYVTFQAGDILLLPDSAWGENPWSAVSDLKAAGGSLVSICYDLIPISHPEFFPPSLASAFKAYLERTVDLADHVVCISKTVQSELDAFASRRLASPQSHCVYPIVTVAEASAKPRADLAAALSGRSIVIVSTIEPRKGHAILLDACEALWKEGHELNLVVIGRVGWQVHKLMARLDQHRERGIRLFLFHDASDADVAYALRHATLMVFPSRAEGLGLPILEAEMSGCPTLCSDIPVFREIASSSTRFFSPHTGPALAAAIVPALADDAQATARTKLLSRPPQADATSYARALLSIMVAPARATGRVETDRPEVLS